jgi:hypothetical protein
LLELGAGFTFIVAEYLTVLPPKGLLQSKLQEAITTARRRFPQAEAT